MSKRRPGFDRDVSATITPHHGRRSAVAAASQTGHAIYRAVRRRRMARRASQARGAQGDGAFDLPSHDARTARYDVKGVDAFVTNPPWQTRPDNLLHPIIVNLSDQAPAWMLIYSDWLFTSQATPLLPRLNAVVVIGRQKWIAVKEFDGFDNCRLAVFDRPHAGNAIRFFGRGDLSQPGSLQEAA